MKFFYVKIGLSICLTGIYVGLLIQDVWVGNAFMFGVIAMILCDLVISNLELQENLRGQKE